MIPRPKRLGNIEPSTEQYFGEAILKAIDGMVSSKGQHPEVPVHELCEQQRLVMRLYENRFASMQRLVGLFVLFHAMGKEVMDFWPRVSAGLLGYDMDRTHSIMRIATTASPVSGAAIRERMKTIAIEAQWKQATNMLKALVKTRKFTRGSSVVRHGFLATSQSTHQSSLEYSSASSTPAVSSSSLTPRTSLLSAPGGSAKIAPL